MNTVYFYRTNSGRNAISEFTHKHSPDVQKDIQNSFYLLREYGLALLNTRWAKKVLHNPSIYELRISGRIEIRALFCFTRGVYTILHIFIKKTNKLPRKELDIAIQRYKNINN